MIRSCVLVFGRAPVAGRVKTRLAAIAGESVAVQAYRRLLAGALAAAAQLENSDFQFWSAEAGGEELLHPLLAPYPQCVLKQQRQGDLGVRMASALAEAAQSLADEDCLLLVGSDVPALRVEHLRQAQTALHESDLIFGPAADGGYYLIAMRAALARKDEKLQSLFDNVAWSQSATLDHQEQRAASLGLRTARTALLADLDVAADLIAARSIDEQAWRDLAPDIRVILPCLNERANLPAVLAPLLACGLFREIIVADNGSSDGSDLLAIELGARVTHCAERGYGAACLTALADIRQRGGCDWVVFCDADGADDPALLGPLLQPLWSGEYDFALIARDVQLSEAGALMPHARFGNWLACSLSALFFGRRFLDLGPFRALRWEALEQLRMDDRNYGWTLQMQLRAQRAGLRIVEIPAAYRRRRAGKSKVTSTLRGSVRAGLVILWTILRERFAAVR
ncbi:MAG: TIGR04282 family arsenosugar biosynthesis glycosyltransferase [Leptospirales bacterium]|nr:TIGR04282 family arsenosugar biosynthesis glycosyltransferase [Leptospirales bacterium]